MRNANTFLSQLFNHRITQLQSGQHIPCLSPCQGGERRGLFNHLFTKGKEIAPLIFGAAVNQVSKVLKLFDAAMLRVGNIHGALMNFSKNRMLAQ